MQSSTASTELEGHPQFEQLRPLIEVFVQRRIQDFARKFVTRLNLGWSEDELLKFVRQTQAADEECGDSIPNSTLPIQPYLGNLKLSFRHECQSSGCGDEDCVLCQYNPDRRCVRNFKTKYLVEDKLRAKCDAPIFVDILTDCDERAAEPVNLQLQVMALDHAKYDEMTRSGVEVTWEMLMSCIVTWSKGVKKVRVLHKPGLADDEMNITFHCEKSSVSLSELSAMVSSEATLTGHRPQYCLLVSAVDENGVPLPHVSHAISEPFTVATRRVKSSAKASIPLVNEDVSKLVHMGKATVEKLLNLKDAARAMSVDLLLPDHLQHITKVGQFKELMELIEGDFSARKKLMAILKLPADKMEEACQHAASAVIPDSRPRIWISLDQQVGLVFKSRRGAIQLDAMEGVVPEPEEDGSYDVSKMIPLVSVTDDALMHAIQDLRVAASTAWRTPSHPGWLVVGGDEELNGTCGPAPGLVPSSSAWHMAGRHATSSSVCRPGTLHPSSRYPPNLRLPEAVDPNSATSPTSAIHDTTSNATSPNVDSTLQRGCSGELRGPHVPAASHAEPAHTGSWNTELERPQWASDYLQPALSKSLPGVGADARISPHWSDGAPEPAGFVGTGPSSTMPGGVYMDMNTSPFESHMSQSEAHRQAAAVCGNVRPGWPEMHEGHRLPKRQNTGLPSAMAKEHSSTIWTANDIPLQPLPALFSHQQENNPRRQNHKGPATARFFSSETGVMMPTTEGPMALTLASLMHKGDGYPAWSQVHAKVAELEESAYQAATTAVSAVPYTMAHGISLDLMVREQPQARHGMDRSLDQ